MKQNFSEHSKILITGACQGLGRSLALLFARNHKCELILMDVREDLSKDLLRELKYLGSRATFYQVDFADAEATARVCERVIEVHDDIDVLVNNAALARANTLLNTPLDAYEQTMRVNFLAPVQLTKLLLPRMVDRNIGHIVNVCSVMSHFSVAGLGDYIASKHALMGHNSCLRLELQAAKSSVAVTGIFPYMVTTGLFAGTRTFLSALFPQLSTDEVVARIYRAILYREKEVWVRDYFSLMKPLLLSLPFVVSDSFAHLMGQGIKHFTGRDQNKFKQE